MPGPETDPGIGGGEPNDEGRYSSEEAQEEASQMREKVESGEAKDYEEAEKLVDQIVAEVPAERKQSVLMALGGIIKSVISEVARSAKMVGDTITESHEAMYRPSTKKYESVLSKYERKYKTVLGRSGLPKKEADEIFPPRGYDDVE